MIFNYAEIFHRKMLFYTWFRKIWVIENSLPVFTKLNKINTKKKDKSISTFNFTTLYLIIHHNLLVKVLSEVINFSFKTKAQNQIGFSNTLVYWRSNPCERRYFTRQTLIDAISFLITKCYLTMRNLVLRQEIGILKNIDPAPYWASKPLSAIFLIQVYLANNI